MTLALFDDAGLALLALVGLLQLLLGYPLFAALVVVAGALLGFQLGPELHGAPSALLLALGALLGALGFAALAWLALPLAAAIWGAALGGLLGVALAPATPWLALAPALALGALAAVFVRPLVVLLSSLHGAWLLVAAGGALLRGPARQATEPGALPGLFPTSGAELLLGRAPLALLVLLLAAAGVMVQLRLSRPLGRI